ncbi:DinB family protein [Paenibacillus puerhi]|uniref:DinB family protein n=1 Tax=Paenibacillus puerhi TaxID=2692622 RepID=UPI001359DA37|nr:DinB family protein [Paenibacillus puerhi]
MKTWERIFEHMEWANVKIVEALRPLGEDSAKAQKLFAHVLGAERIWLSRIRGEDTSSFAIWPEPDIQAYESLVQANGQGYQALLAEIDDQRLAAPVVYRNSQGTEFQTPLADILSHVALHGMYHRGQINLLLRIDDREPASIDYILFARES